MLKPNLRSIRFRLTAWYAGVLALTFLCAAILLWLALNHSIKATLDKELRARFDTVRRYVEQEASGEGMTHLSEELNEDAVVNSASSYLRIADLRGRLIYSSPNAEDWPMRVPDAERVPARGVSETVRIRSKPFRVLTALVSIGTVQIGSPLEEFDEMQRQFLWTAAFGIPLLLLVAAAAGYCMSARALRPVERIANAAQRITSANLSERLPYSGAGDELDRLSEVLNEMLAGLESAFRRMTQFTADASHELRTPLAVIRTTAELMRSRLRSAEEQGRAWASVLAQTERTTQLVDDLLTLARGEAGAAPLDFQPVDVKALASMAVSDMQVLASAKGVLLQFSASAEPVIRADEEPLRRVFTILLDNALKATRLGGTVEVSVTAEGEGKQRAAVIAVRDNGVGISSEDLPHIFDRFYRASKDRSRESGGAGLGLSIAQWIVSRHAGSIEVESQLGQGALFRVILPALLPAIGSFSNSSESTLTL